MSSRAIHGRASCCFLGVLVFGLVAAGAGDRPPLDYGYGARSTGVLEVHFLSSTSMKTVQFTVYGDGGLKGKVVGTGTDRPVLEEFEHRFDEAEVSDLVEAAVTSGLIDFDPDRFSRGVRERGETVPYVIDGGAVFFKIELDFLERRDGRSEAPFSHSFVLAVPEEYARRFPEKPEFRALQRIVQALEEIYWARSKER